jgi:hypothetical protein
MRRTSTVFASLSWAAAGLVASIATATEPVTTPTTAQPAPSPEVQGVVKTRTKSNNSND